MYSGIEGYLYEHSIHDLPLTSSPEKTAEAGITELKPLWPSPIEILQGVAGIRKSLLLNNKRHLITQDTEDVVCVWDIICCCKIKTLGKVDFNEAYEKENPVEWVANWCSVQTNLGVRYIVIKNIYSIFRI